MRVEALVGAGARYRQVSGSIVRIHKTGKNLWWVPEGGDMELMFSLRADGAWRAFPGSASAAPLEILSIYSEKESSPRVLTHA